MNKDIYAVQQSYDDLKRGLLSGDDKRVKAFVANAPQYIQWLQKLDVALKVHKEELDRLAAKVRLHLEKDPSWLRKQKLKLMPNPELSEEEIQAEIDLLHREEEASATEDQSRINRMKTAE
jgi:hypothetical protein